MAPSLSVRDPDGYLQWKACSSLGKEEWWSWRRLHQRLVSSAAGGVVEVLRVLLYRLQSRLEVAVDKGRDAYVRIHFPIQAVYTMSQGYTGCCHILPVLYCTRECMWIPAIWSVPLHASFISRSDIRRPKASVHIRRFSAFIMQDICMCMCWGSN